MLLSAAAVVVHVGIISITFSKLGLTRESAFLLLFCSLFGSLINIPLFTIKSTTAIQVRDTYIPAYLKPYLKPLQGRTLVAVNVGGCLIPLFFSIYLYVTQPLMLYEALFGILIVAFISYVYSFPVKGVGIGMPMLIAPLFAAIAAIAAFNAECFNPEIDKV